MPTEYHWPPSEKCRLLAKRYTGRPEKDFLLNVAASFDKMASEVTSKGELR